MKKIILFLLPLFLIGCISLHNLSEEKEFNVASVKNEEVWSRAHDHLARTKPDKFSTGFITDYSIILIGYLDNRNTHSRSSNLFTPYYYHLTLTRHRSSNDYIYYIRLHGQDIENIEGEWRGKVNKNSKESGLLQEEIEKFYENIAGVKK
jgi:hypothetical protein